MMSKYRTAMGKTIDMTALAAKNDKVRAVGNMSVNARGDTIDAHGKVIVPSNRKVTDNYQKSVRSTSSSMPSQPLKSTIVADDTYEEQLELTMEERELEMITEDDIAVEEIKAQETNKDTKGTKNK